MTAPRTAAEWIRALDLVPHREGGHYRETYRSAQTNTPPGFTGPRALSTAIYFLLQGREVSSLHRLRSDELWHFHAGSTLRVVELTAEGALHEHRLGLDVGAGGQPHRTGRELHHTPVGPVNPAQQPARAPGPDGPLLRPGKLVQRAVAGNHDPLVGTAALRATGEAP